MSLAMRTTLREHLLLLPAELAWLTRLRWLAGLAILAGAVAHGAWYGWSAAHGGAVAIGSFVLLYNAIFWFASGGGSAVGRAETMLPLAGVPIVLDLGCLTVLVLLTGGVVSPLLGLFILHMVLGMLLMPPLVGYGVAVLAVAMMLGGLWASGQLPSDRTSVLLIGVWTITLLLTAFVTGHITARLRGQESRSRDQQSRLRAILDTAADGIITIDERGTIQSVNPAAARTFGYTVGEMLGRNVNMLMPEPDHSRHDRYIADYLRTGRAKIIGIGREVRGRRKCGEVFPLHLAISEVGTDGAPGVRLFTGILRDITARKTTENELRHANDTLKRQQQALVQSEKMSAMGKMAAGVAHEIANPLASMDSILQLSQRRSGQMSSKSIGSLREQVVRISHIVRELTTFAHPDEAEWRTVPLNELVREALRMIRYERRLRGVNVRCDCSNDVGSVRAIPQQMHQVLINLVLNALDALEGVEQPLLIIRTGRADEGAWQIIEVTDNGHGIEPDKIDRVFEPFYTTKPAGCGTGLGLSISYSIVQRHGGRLEMTSTVGRGTKLTILLPGPIDASPGRDGSGAHPAIEKNTGG